MNVTFGEKTINSNLNHLSELNCMVWTIWITCITAFRNPPKNRVIPLEDKL